MKIKVSKKVVAISLVLLAFVLVMSNNKDQTPADNTGSESSTSKTQETQSDSSDTRDDDALTVKTDPKNDEKNNDEGKTGDLPRLLEIPKIEVSANIQHVGLNSKGGMDVPSNDVDVAWFDLGTEPGDKGSSVIAGHLDTKIGHTAVFWDLYKLEAGDYVWITNNNDSKERFQVVDVQKYGAYSSPMEKIFGLSNGRYLNLITCGGVWDKVRKTYSERLVVFTEYSPLEDTE